MSEDKKILYVDGREVEFTNEKNLLEVIRKAGIEVPTFCYRPDLTQYGACRMCVVEIEGRGIQSSCTMPPEAGLKVHVNTDKTRRIRKTVLELLLANHDRECTTCSRSGNCELQKYSQQYGIKDIRFESIKTKTTIDESNPSIVRDPNKCILCGACVRACDEIQAHGVLGIINRGSDSLVTPAYKKEMGQADCLYCGQCVNVCPVGALTIRSEVEAVWKEINNSNKKVVSQMAPAVRVAVGEAFGLEPGVDSTGKIVAALRKIGFDKVYDTNFAADLTIMEEATEFVTRVTTGGKLPLFTSCCPAWVRYAEQRYPELLDNLSTCKSPQQMFGAVSKKITSEEFGIDRKDLCVVSIMPCTAKKAEARRYEFSVDGDPDINYVLTTQELIVMIKEAGIDFSKLEPEHPDNPLGAYTGAGVIFGASGGVAEAALRTAYKMVSGKELECDDIKAARGTETLKEFTVTINGLDVRVAIINTLSAAKEVCDDIIKGNIKYDLIEVMACPNGCVNGAGQPISCKNVLTRVKRAQGLYNADVALPSRKSHENKDVQAIYDKWLEKPNSHKAHEALHTHYTNRKEISYKNVKK